MKLEDAVTFERLSQFKKKLTAWITEKLSEIEGTPGPAGPTGAPGKDGAAATITIGTVTTGEPGTAASVKNVGTATAAKFDITIPKGAKGETGAQGAKGATGTRGSTLTWGTLLSGTSTTTGAVSSASIGSALKGDLYLNTSTYGIYECTTAGSGSSAKWTYRGSIKGATGATGETGAKGADGKNGTNGTSAVWHTGTAITGTGTSSVSVSGAKAGDMYLNTSTYAVYKASSASSWTYQCNIKGATGAQGQKGDAGAKGETGAQGVKGDTGAQGAQGAKGDKGERGANATLVVAASNSSDKSKAAADYKCDGTADQIEINNAIAALPSCGGKVLLLEGTYNIHGSITIEKANVTIEGMGAGTVLKRMFDDPVEINRFWQNGIIHFGQSENCAVRNIAIDGNNTLYPGGNNAAIKTMNETIANLTVSRLTIINEHHGIMLAGGAHNCRILGNAISDVYGIGIYLYNTYRNIICDNHIYNAEIGIQLEWNSKYNKISNNYIARGTGEENTNSYEATQLTIYILSGTNNDVSDNFIWGKNYTNNGGDTNTFENNRYQ